MKTSALAIAGLVSLFAFACTEAVGDDEVDLSSHPIVGGQPADRGEYAGTVALYRNSQQICGGTLVAADWVITAAHCIVSPSAVNGGISKVVINKLKLSETGGESIAVKKAIRHAGYNSSTLANDIALLQLDTPSASPQAKVVQPSQLTSLVADSMTTVVGWGTTREGGGTSDALLEVDVPVISNDKCKAFPRYNNVNDGMICAGYVDGGKDSCQGDSGGPLFMKVDGQLVHVGIVSWGIGCARRNAPGVYTRTSTHFEWLRTQTNGAVGTPDPVTPPTEPTQPPVVTPPTAD